MGLSDRLRDRRLPPIEERMDDLRAVLDAAGVGRALLAAGADGGPLACLFAATYPERTLGLVLMNTAPRIAWAPDYPWGLRRDEFERELEAMEAGWGTPAYAEEHAPWPMEGMTREEAVEWWLEWMRLSAAPGDAVALWQMFYDSDVRDVLGTIRVPTLVLSRGGEMEGEAKAFAALVPGARQETMPGSARTVMQEHPDAYIDAVERFARELHEEEAELESVLATVLFTDIVDSTARQAEIGDRRWADLLRDHHAVVRGCLARYRGRELDTAGDGFFAAFDGPARGIRCARAIVEGRAPARPRGAGGAPHGGVPLDRGQGRRSRGLDRGARDVARRPVGDPRLPDRARSRRRLGARARRPRRARAQGRPGRVEGVRGGLTGSPVSRLPRRTAPAPPAGSTAARRAP